ncbi:MAG: DHH family phosphoesterase [Coriobacteriales bacterium]|jgi:phosphoesterase RecJ-like protein|nr:DHH family phosphoesterase [Coriobacteriales bacterium]
MTTEITGCSAPTKKQESKTLIGSPAEVLAALKDVKTAAICGHVNPDGDSLGSSLALAALLEQLGISAIKLLAQDRPSPHIYSFLDNYEFVPAVAYKDVPDIFFLVDAPSLGRIGDGAEVFKRARRTVVIDHHPDYEGAGDIYYGDVKSPATGSLIWKIIAASGVAPTLAMAKACYIAIMTDTGRFSFQNTNAEAFEFAAQMIRLGVEPTDVSQRVYENKSLGVVQLESRLVQRMQFLRAGKVAYSWIAEQDFNELGIERDDSEGLPTILRSIKGVQVAVLLREEEGSVRVNLRSRSCCDVGTFARENGGGGHRAAAGITLNMSLEEAIASFVPKFASMECIIEA